LEILRKALDCGAEWVDLEEDADRGPFEGCLDQVVLSHHDFHSTPKRAALYRLAERMAATGVKVIKVAAVARTPEDNLSILDLIPFGERELGVRVIAFCMGPLGRWSRLAGLLLGSPWAYVRLPGSPSAAPGQFTADEMRGLLETLRSLP
jgi:3-dehydroquinate dehydratase type I